MRAGAERDGKESAGDHGKSLRSGDRRVEGSGNLLTTVDDEIAGGARRPAAGSGDSDRHAPRPRGPVSKIERDAARRASGGGRVRLPLDFDALWLIPEAELLRQPARARRTHSRHAHRHLWRVCGPDAVNLPVQRYAPIGAESTGGENSP